MLWDDFLNSSWHDWRGSGRSEDRLDNPKWIEQWLEHHDLMIHTQPDTSTISRLKELRLFLFGIVERITKGILPTSNEIDKLNELMAQEPIQRQLVQSEEGYRLVTFPLQMNWKYVESEIAASFAQTIVQGELTRIRICENPDCLWVYYDDTRNRSKRFCDHKLCGNLMKVRRFRERQKGVK